jgi:hypothetical protein
MKSREKGTLNNTTPSVVTCPAPCHVEALAKMEGVKLHEYRTPNIRLTNYKLNDRKGI